MKERRTDTITYKAAFLLEISRLYSEVFFKYQYYGVFLQKAYRALKIRWGGMVFFPYA